MTDIADDDAPVFALVDDHIHSARLLTRTLRETDSPAQVKWLGGVDRAFPALQKLLGDADSNTPDMIIVDLKSHTGANEEFISRIAPHAKSVKVPIAAIVASPDAGNRQRLISAGAKATFTRHHELNAYRREVSQISSFWVRETSTWLIRA